MNFPNQVLLVIQQSWYWYECYEFCPKRLSFGSLYKRLYYTSIYTTILVLCGDKIFCAFRNMLPSKCGKIQHINSSLGTKYISVFREWTNNTKEKCGFLKLTKHNWSEVKVKRCSLHIRYNHFSWASNHSILTSWLM